MTLKSFIWQNRLIEIAPVHCFHVTLADFGQIINDDFIHLEADDWITLIIFPESQTNLE